MTVIACWLGCWSPHLNWLCLHHSFFFFLVCNVWDTSWILVFVTRAWLQSKSQTHSCGWHPLRRSRSQGDCKHTHLENVLSGFSVIPSHSSPYPPPYSQPVFSSSLFPLLPFPFTLKIDKSCVGPATVSTQQCRAVEQKFAYEDSWSDMGFTWCICSDKSCTILTNLKWPETWFGRPSHVKSRLTNSSTAMCKDLQSGHQWDSRWTDATFLGNFAYFIVLVSILQMVLIYLSDCISGTSVDLVGEANLILAS